MFDTHTKQQAELDTKCKRNSEIVHLYRFKDWRSIIIQTDRTIPNNKPDITIRDNEKGTCMLIDVAISGDRNVVKMEAEKILNKTLQ